MRILKREEEFEEGEFEDEFESEENLPEVVCTKNGGSHFKVFYKGREWTIKLLNDYEILPNLYTDLNGVKYFPFGAFLFVKEKGKENSADLSNAGFRFEANRKYVLEMNKDWSGMKVRSLQVEWKETEIEKGDDDERIEMECNYRKGEKRHLLERREEEIEEKWNLMGVQVREKEDEDLAMKVDLVIESGWSERSVGGGLKVLVKDAIDENMKTVTSKLRMEDRQVKRVEMNKKSRFRIFCFIFFLRKGDNNFSLFTEKE